MQTLQNADATCYRSFSYYCTVQAHPDKKLAQQLHEKFPSIYKDPNHKPEMVIALTPFECMCGFRTIAEIHQHFAAFPEFVTIIDHSGM